jgi:four helix bundle protein
MAGVSRYEDLIVWRVADELRQGVFELTETGPASKDFKFRDQIRDSSSSPTRNIAEGFGRLSDSEFAWFMRVARGSLSETHDHLHDGLRRGYFSDADTTRLQRLALRAVKASTGLIDYLDPPSARPRRKKGRPLKPAR